MEPQGRLVTISELTLRDREQMFQLMDQNYAGVRRAEFEADLDEKQWAIVLRDPLGVEVVGFSTQMLMRAEVGGQQITALFSGDTIVDRSYWGQQVLSRIWGRLALNLIDSRDNGGGGLYWFLIAKGYKTYRFLPLFFHDFYPRFDRPLPAGLRAIRDALATCKFAAQFDAQRGVIQTQSDDACRLRPGIAPLEPGRLGNPHVRFFGEVNPGHERGDELCCVAPLTRENFTSPALRVIGHSGVAMREIA